MPSSRAYRVRLLKSMHDHKRLRSSTSFGLQPRMLSIDCRLAWLGWPPCGCRDCRADKGFAVVAAVVRLHQRTTTSSRTYAVASEMHTHGRAHRRRAIDQTIKPRPSLQNIQGQAVREFFGVSRAASSFGIRALGLYYLDISSLPVYPLISNASHRPPPPAIATSRRRFDRTAKPIPTEGHCPSPTPRR